MILTINAIAPNGDRLKRGQELPADVGDQFRADIEQYLIDGRKYPLLNLPVTTAEEAEDAWRKVQDAKPLDPMTVVAADRIRILAAEIGHDRVARLRPLLDRLDPPEQTAEPTAEKPVALEGRSHRRRTQS